MKALTWGQSRQCAGCHLAETTQQPAGQQLQSSLDPVQIRQAAWIWQGFSAARRPKSEFCHAASFSPHTIAMLLASELAASGVILDTCCSSSSLQLALDLLCQLVKVKCLQGNRAIEALHMQTVRYWCPIAGLYAAEPAVVDLTFSLAKGRGISCSKVKHLYHPPQL